MSSNNKHNHNHNKIVTPNPDILVAVKPDIQVPPHVAFAEARRRRQKAQGSKKSFIPTEDDVQKAIQNNPMDPGIFFLAKWMESDKGKDSDKWVYCPVCLDLVEQYRGMGYECLPDDKGDKIIKGDTVLMFAPRELAEERKKIPAILDARRMKNFRKNLEAQKNTKFEVPMEDFSTEAINASVEKEFQNFKDGV